MVTGEDIRKLVPEPYYGPAFHDQPVLALDKVRLSASWWPWCSPPIRTCREAAHLITAEYEELPAVYERSRRWPERDRARGAWPAGTFPDLKYPKGRRTPTSRLIFT